MAQGSSTNKTKVVNIVSTVLDPTSQSISLYRILEQSIITSNAMSRMVAQSLESSSSKMYSTERESIELR